jgi:aminopeptidase N
MRETVMKRLFTTCFFTLLLFSVASAQQPDQKEVRQMMREFEKQRFENQMAYLAKSPTPNQTQYNIHSYTLNLDVWPSTEVLYGAVLIEGSSLVNGLSQLEFDLLYNMTVDSVFQNGSAITYSHPGDLLTVQLLAPLNLNDSFSVLVYYHGDPQSVGLGTWGWDYHQGNPIVWTLSEPFGAPAWWPCKDDPSDKADSVFMNVTVPNNLVATSNGLLKNVFHPTPSRDTYSWETHYPISNYLVSLAISNYAQFNDWYVALNGDSMELNFFVYPEHLSQAQTDFSVTKDMIAAYAGILGEYPFIEEKYGMAIFPWGGGMEHQTLTSYGAPLVTGSHYYDWIIAHELSHQWFGDCITMKRWSHIWMNEGFASYCEALWEEHLHGTVAYHNYLTSQDPGYFSGSLFVYDSTNVNALFGNTVYDKGSWALHMLRGILGDSLFFASLRSYANDPQLKYGNATTEDFRDVCEAVSGMDLHWYFDEWVYRSGRPNYVYSWQTTGGEGPYNTVLILTQSNSTPYKMPLQIRLTAGGIDTTMFTIWDSLAYQQFQFSTPYAPQTLQVDPNHWVLKNLSQGSVYTVGGSIIDAGSSSGVANAYIVWEGPYDPLTGAPYGTGVDSTDINGHFQVSLVSGDYAFVAAKDSFLRSETVFRHVTGNVSNLTLALSQPKATFSMDSLVVVLDENETLDTTLTISNTGSGMLFVQAAETNIMASDGNKKAAPLLRSMFPVEQLEKTTAQPPSNEIGPVDSLWQHLHHDPRENTQNFYDVSDTYVQTNGALIYVKSTMHMQPPNFGSLRINYFLDTDYSNLTGLSIYGMGADYVVAVGDFGAGINAYLLQWNPVTQTFDLVGAADYFESNLSEKFITVGVTSTLFTYPDRIRFYYNAYNYQNLVNSFDYVPSSNQGYLSASFNDIAWLGFDPLFDIANADSDAVLTVTLTPQNMSSGYYLSGITVFTTHAGEMEQTFIPVRMEYVTSLASPVAEVPDRFELSQNYPNPFNPVTTISYALPQNSDVEFVFFNMLGQRVDYVRTGRKSAGYHKIQWNGEDYPSGIYFYKMNARAPNTGQLQFSKTGKMLLVR